LIAAAPRRPAATAIAGGGVPQDPSSAQAGPHAVARLVPLDPGFYAFSLAAERDGSEALAGLALPTVQLSTPPQAGGRIEITDSFGRAGSWLGGRHEMLFVIAPPGGGAVLATAYFADAPDTTPLALEIRRVDLPAGAAIAADSAARPLAQVIRLGGGTSAALPRQVSLEIIAHIRGRGDVRFVDPLWAGRLQPGLWIEALTIRPRQRSVAASIEYKGLTASGAETPWVGSGTPCGTRGQGTPLIGFAVRQKAAAGGALFDCEYAGYFQSGATSAPARNGAPCRSTIDGDPLEGIQLRIAARPADPTAE
jgi:hypothetical protein